MKDIQAWLDRIITDEKFAQKNNGKTIAEIIKIAKQNDYDITKEDILANVAGGKLSVKVDTRIAIANATALALGKDAKATEASTIIINQPNQA